MEKMRKTILILLLSLTLFIPLNAQAQFVNGGFEDGDFTGWEQGAGYWYGGIANLTPPNYLPGGPFYNFSANASDIVTPGDDPIVGSALNRVYSGNYSARINDWVNNYSVSVIKQTVGNWTDPNIFFAWAAVLESSHGPTDSDNFILNLRDDTQGIDLITRVYNSAVTPQPPFIPSGYWFYTPWQVEQLDVSQYSGDTFTLSLLASDCPYGGHAGYVYLDGFGAAPPQPTVPEPTTMILLGCGLLGLVGMRKKFKK